MDDRSARTQMPLLKLPEVVGSEGGFAGAGSLRSGIVYSTRIHGTVSAVRIVCLEVRFVRLTRRERLNVEKLLYIRFVCTGQFPGMGCK